MEVAGYADLLQKTPGFVELQALEPGSMVNVELFLSVIGYLDQHYPAGRLAYDVEYKYFHSGQLNMLGALGQLIQVSSTLMDVSESFFRYYGQFNRIFTPSVEVRGEFVAFKIVAADHALWQRRAFQVVIEMFVYGTIRMAREVFGDASLGPLSLAFPYDMPTLEKDQIEQTVGAAVARGAELVVLWPRELASRPLPFADPALGKHLKSYLDRELASKSVPEVVRVKEMIHDRLPQLLTLEAAASGLFLSSRSLQRRLKQQDASFQELMDEVRRDLALSLLEGGTLTIKGIADACGFTDVTSFFRAFKKWTGKTPMQVVKS